MIVRFKLQFKLPSLAAAAMALLPIWVSAASANPVLVADAATGRVIYAEQARDPWYPASVTKLVTTYVVLSAIRDGRLTLDTPLTVSAEATGVIPSKMGFPPGTVLTVDNALKMMLVKSANDMAAVLAEGVGGSVDRFADLMNDAARRLGMTDSHFVNPNGLPDERNRTSARDLALVARALLTEFPQYSGYFGIGAIKFGRRVMQNTNGLIGRYPGADGMKTGFICASGFNVVATAERGGKRLIVVVLGASSGANRTIKAAELFDYGFADSGWGGPGTLQTLPASLSTTPPDIRDQACGRHRRAPSEDEAELPMPIEANAFGGNSENPNFEIFNARPTGGAALVMGKTKGRLGPRAHFDPLIVSVMSSPAPAPATATAAASKKTRSAKTRHGHKGEAVAKAKSETKDKTASKGKAKPESATAYAPTSSEAASAPPAIRNGIKPAGALQPGELKPAAGAIKPGATSHAAKAGAIKPKALVKPEKQSDEN